MGVGIGMGGRRMMIGFEGRSVFLRHSYKKWRDFAVCGLEVCECGRETYLHSLTAGSADRYWYPD